MTGPPSVRWAAPAAVLIATSAAPEVAPSRTSEKGEAGEIVGGEDDDDAGQAEQGQQRGDRALVPAVDGPTGEQHRRQGAGADEQQRGAEPTVGDRRLVADRRKRRAPRAPERAEDGEARIRVPSLHCVTIHNMARPTMADVARAAGVSVMTVSYTYSRPARESLRRRSRR